MKGLYKKLFEIQGMSLRFEKSADNPFFHSKYLPLEDLQAKLNPTLQEKGLLVVHALQSGHVVTAVIDTEDDQKIESMFPIQAGIDPQKVGSAITYGKRYNLGALFNIITDEDDDANTTQPQKKAAPKITSNDDIPC